eukprot:CAMPEP_0116887922 /NCGR_PEP_ID=MMETSP0463-20121206/22639_1 /TAXON_ID=181622 /ORGANISM="Strombidinopsis sp, Strain SopsisLIS2011" /LENGTH=37 /DNA_ID= /DNA_START= /DNA_END= /DNA_ORIENTATION=
MIDSDAEIDDIEDKGYLIAYWRCDEGKGAMINDVTDN